MTLGKKVEIAVFIAFLIIICVSTVCLYKMSVRVSKNWVLEKCMQFWLLGPNAWPDNRIAENKWWFPKVKMAAELFTNGNGKWVLLFAPRGVCRVDYAYVFRYTGEIAVSTEEADSLDIGCCPNWCYKESSHLWRRDMVLSIMEATPCRDRESGRLFLGPFRVIANVVRWGSERKRRIN